MLENEKEIIKGKVNRRICDSYKNVCKMCAFLLILLTVSLPFVAAEDEEMFWINLCLAGFFLLDLIVMAIYYLVLTKSEIVVTNYRVYGKKGVNGIRVDLPLKSISATGINGKYCVYIATSAGKINFYGVENAEDIYKVINKLLNEIQETSTVKKDDEIDKIKKYKELLDMGAITQEEFDVKKKELLK